MQYPGSLHGHTEYSNLRLRDCIIKLEDYIEYAAELGHEVVALTDHETISGHVKAEKIYKKVKEKYPNFKLIRGNEIYLCRDGLNKDNYRKGIDKYYHFILLAKDSIGHEQIREISSRAWKRSYMMRGMRRVPTYYRDIAEVIGTNKGHVIGATACLGSMVGTQLINLMNDEGNIELYKKIKNWCLAMSSFFSEGDFYLELQPSATKEQTYVNRKLIELSKELNFPYIITTDSHYLKKEDRVTHKAYLNAQNGDREVDAFYATTYMMNTQELESHLTNMSREELDIAYQNILDIKDKCSDYSLLKPLRIPEMYWKDYEENIQDYEYYVKKMPTLEKFFNSEYKGDKKLVWGLISGIKNKKDLQNDEAYETLEVCLTYTWTSSLKNNAHWSAYLLNLPKNIDLCWEAGSLVGPARGSGTGFLLLYALDIIQINHLREKTSVYPWRLTRKGSKASYLW